MLKYKVFMFLFLCLMLFTACSSEKINQVDNNVIVGVADAKDKAVEIKTIPTNDPAKTNTNDSDQKAEEEWTSYSNDRFGFTIKYPSSWVADEEAENGDGKVLYIGNPDIDIRVYAGQYLEGSTDIQQNEKFDKKYTKLENGNEAFLLLDKENGKVIYDMVYVSSEDIEYHFYAAVTEEFFVDNEKILLDVARSLDTPK